MSWPREGKQNDNGHWLEEHDKIYEVVMEYFQNLLSAENNTTNYVLDDIQTCMTEHQNEELLLPFTTQEFKDAIFDIKPDKFSGPDG